MNAKSLTTLTAVTVAAFAAAFVASRGNGSSSDAATTVEAYPDFTERVNDVAEVEVFSAGMTSTVKKSEDGWNLMEKGGYPVKVEQVREAIVRLSKFEVIEPKTSRPENFEALGLQDPETEDAASKRVVLRDASGAEIASLILGNTKFFGRQPTIFVRPTDSNQTYHCEGRVTLESDPLKWIDREVLKLDANRVMRVVIEHPDGDVVRLEREGDTGDYKVQDIPEGMQETYRGTSNSTATALSFLRMDDILPRNEIDFSIEPVAKATYYCEDGLVIALELSRVDEKVWAGVNAIFEKPTTAEGEEDVSVTEEELKEAEVEARGLQRTFDRWAYHLPDFKVTAIAKKTSDLITEIPDPTEDTGEEGLMPEAGQDQ